MPRQDIHKRLVMALFCYSAIYARSHSHTSALTTVFIGSLGVRRRGAGSVGQTPHICADIVGEGDRVCDGYPGGYRCEKHATHANVRFVGMEQADCSGNRTKQKRNNDWDLDPKVWSRTCLNQDFSQHVMKKHMSRVLRTRECSAITYTCQSQAHLHSNHSAVLVSLAAYVDELSILLAAVGVGTDKRAPAGSGAAPPLE